MSLWKFNDFEVDVDFTDADFMEKFENAYEDMRKDIDHTPKTGKVSNMIRAQCNVFDTFFEKVFGEKAIDKMFLGKKSVELRIEACNSLYDFRNSENSRYNSLMCKYKPNRKQRRQAERNNQRNVRR